MELIKLLFACNSSLLLVGDPRQGTYSTNSAPKNKQFRKSKVENYFFQDKTIDVETDRTSLQINFRCNSEICDLSNRLFPNFSPTKSGNNTITGHDGIFLVDERDIDSYLKFFKPIQLRDSRKREVHTGFDVMNFGESKGLTFDRVLIYPTKPFIDWLKDNNTELAETSRSKLYVAITRARYSIGIVFNSKLDKIDGINNYANPSC